MRGKKPEPSKILIPAPDLKMLKVKIEGLSPLLMNRWSEKAMRQIEDTQSGAPKSRKKPARDPRAEFEAAAYLYPGGGYGFPAASFRLAAISACRMIDGLPMTQARLLFLVLADSPEGELVKIEGPKPTMDMRPVRLANGSADLRYRPLFWPWKATLNIRYNAGATSAEQIANLLMLAGECIGVGELRPEKGGTNGRFTIK